MNVPGVTTKRSSFLLHGHDTAWVSATAEETNSGHQCSDACFLVVLPNDGRGAWLLDDVLVVAVVSVSVAGAVSGEGSSFSQ